MRQNVFKITEEIFIEIGKNNKECSETINNCGRIFEIIIKLLNSEAQRKVFRYLVDKKKVLRRK